MGRIATRQLHYCELSDSVLNFNHSLMHNIPSEFSSIRKHKYVIIPIQILVYHLNSDIPELDLILLGKADYFIGNCISSFSAFVKRERDINGKPSEFFALDQLKSDTLQRQKTEL